RSRSGRALPLTLAGLVLAGGGAAAGVLATRGGGDTRVVTTKVLRTDTGRSQTVTVPTTVPAASSAPATTRPRPSGNPHTLNDRGYSLMRQGDYGRARPLLQRAVAGLRGAGPRDPYEAYANYN